MSEHQPELVWYVAYGSNLAHERLRCYLDGTRPAGAARAMRGARDPRPPGRVVPCRVSGRLHFGGDSTLWGGGVAYYDPDGGGEVWAMRYLLTWSQFEDLLAHENASPTEPVPWPLDPAIGERAGRYRRVVELDVHDGHPSLTFTASRLPTASPPSAAYLAWVIRGLRAGHGADAGAIADYLWSAAGVAEGWTRAQLENHAGA